MTTARDIMSKKVVSIEPSVSATEVAKLMDRNNVSCVVLMLNEEPYGIITERDLVSKVTALNKRSSEIKAEEIMSSPVTLISPGTPTDEVAQKMVENKIRRVVVVDGHQPVGIITVTDFVKHLNSILEDFDDYKKDLYQSLIDEYDHWKG
ncbi:MAG TPA: CBS domain-containing protein [Nitrosopumilaceae archaeon]|nr:CBS domain-containing protein [Nitrosopumilaceae archaeon]